MEDEHLDESQNTIENKASGDVVILAGPPYCRKVFVGHRLMLAAESPVFQELFFGVKPLQNSSVIIPDVTVHGFQLMMDYIYRRKETIESLDEAMDAFLTGQRFMIPNLHHKCKEYLENVHSLTSDSVCQVYELSQELNLHDLAYKCLKIVDQETSEVINSKGFKTAKLATVQAIVKRRLISSSEYELFSAIVRWGKEECKRQLISTNRDNLKKILRTLIPHIRFSSMTTKELRKAEKKSLVLFESDKEYANVGVVDLSPRTHAEYYKYQLHITDKNENFLEEDEFSLHLEVIQGSTYFYGVRLALQAISTANNTFLDVLLKVKNLDNGSELRTQTEFLNTTLLPLITFSPPLFIEEGQTAVLFLRVVKSQNLKTFYHTCRKEIFQSQSLSFSVIPRTLYGLFHACLFKEIMLYY